MGRKLVVWHCPHTHTQSHKCICSKRGANKALFVWSCDPPWTQTHFMLLRRPLSSFFFLFFVTVPLWSLFVFLSCSHASSWGFLSFQFVVSQMSFRFNNPFFANNVQITSLKYVPSSDKWNYLQVHLAVARIVGLSTNQCRNNVWLQYRSRHWCHVLCIIGEI